MKTIFVTLFFVLTLPHFAFGNQDIYVNEINTQEGSELIIPEDINWTQRFILTELKELRTSQELLRRELNTELNNRELASIDRALAYSGNTVNFLWLIITMAVTGFGLVGWRTMKDVRENLTNNFEKEVQSRVKAEQKKLETFMKKFEQEQLKQSQDILKNQEFLHKKQEAAYYWSQYNREENPAQKIELLEKISLVGIDEDVLFIHVEKSGIYNELGLWDKSFEESEKGLEISSDNASLLYNKAAALSMLEQKDEALRELSHILGLNPGMKDELLEDPVFENLKKDILEYFSTQEV